MLVIFQLNFVVSNYKASLTVVNVRNGWLLPNSLHKTQIKINSLFYTQFCCFTKL